MALGLQSGGGGGDFDRTPIIKYDARAGRIFRIDRANIDGAWQTDQVEITSGFQAIMDLENIEVGYLHFPAGAAPSLHMVKFGETMPAKPSTEHKQGFRVLMKLGKSSGGDVREMAANAAVSIAGIDELHTAYTAGVAANPGLLPVVALETTKAITKTGKDANGKPQSSTNYQPVWSIVKWVERPAELSGATAATGETKPAEAKAEPEPAKAPARELVDAGEEF